MMPTARHPRPHLVILAIIAVLGLAIAVGAGLSIATSARFIMDDGDYLAFFGLAVAGLTSALTALAVLVGRVVRPAPPSFWRVAALLGIAICAGLASGSCSLWAADTDTNFNAVIAVGLGAAALALLITVAVIKIIADRIAADRGVVRFYALAGIAAYPAGWLIALAWDGDTAAFHPLGYAGIVFVIPAAALAATRAWRQYRINPLTAVAIGCGVALAASLGALAFAWGFHANSSLCPIFDWGVAPACQSHLNAVVFTLIAGGVPPALAAGAAWVAGDFCQRRARPPP